MAANTTAEEWDMNKHRIINARNLAIAMGVLAALLIVVVIVLTGGDAEAQTAHQRGEEPEVENVLFHIVVLF